MSEHLRYASYIVRHKWFVLVAGRKIGTPFWRLIVHDLSKLRPREWSPYVEFFYGKASDEAEASAAQDAFDRAWLFHQHSNPHHWQFWILREDDGGEKVLPMPRKYVYEMVADWMGAGRAITGRWEVAAVSTQAPRVPRCLGVELRNRRDTRPI
jgi:hypothetical protein